MARIHDEQVARLKTGVSIVRLVEAAGVEFKKHGGSDLVGRARSTTTARRRWGSRRTRISGTAWGPRVRS